MKKLKNFMAAALVLTVGAGAAFASNAAKHAQAVTEIGYYVDENSFPSCVATEVQCTTDAGPTCTWTDASSVSHDLYRFNGTMCGQELHRPSN